jgi:hypothetical protein
LDPLIQIKVSTLEKVLDDLLNCLFTITQNKLPYIEVRQADRISEITALLTAVTWEPLAEVVFACHSYHHFDSSNLENPFHGC